MRTIRLPVADSYQVLLLAVPMAHAATILIAALSLVMAADAAAADTSEHICKQIDELNADASQLKHQKKYQELDRLRVKRWRLAGELHAAAPGKSVWAKAHKALAEVDGITREDDGHAPGLIDQLRYQEAYELLLKTWREISLEQEIVPSEVATRLFEVTQQAMSNTAHVFKDEPASNGDSFASRKELTEILEAASTRDPCGVLAAVMNSFIDKPTTSEVFLRMEVRPSMTKRQELLSNLAHPAMLVAGGPPAAVAAGKQNVVELNSAAGIMRTERADVPIQSWHAPVEWCRIKNLSVALEDIDYCRYLTPDELPNGKKGKYITPGEIIGVVDADGNPAELLYGRLLIYRTMDALHRNRTAISYVNEAGRWIRKYVDVLVLDSRATKQENTSATRLSQVLEMVPAVASVELGDVVVAVKELPPGKTSAFLQQSSEVFSAIDVFRILETSYSLTDNNPTFLNDLECSLLSQFESQIFTTPEISRSLAAFKKDADPTKHPLRELLLTRRHSPLVVVSLNDGMPAEPSWLKDGDAVYLDIVEGGRLKYMGNGNGAEKTFEVDFGNGVTSVFPLNTHAMPLGVLMQSRAADVLLRMLADAGYKRKAAEVELKKFISTPLYFPAKSLERLGKRASAKQQSLAVVVEETLKELGWNAVDGTPRDNLLQTRQQFGIRFLKEPRGSYVLHPHVRKLQSEEDEKTPEQRTQELLGSPPYLVVRPSGEQVPYHQIYTFADYQQLWGNRYEEHTKKMIALHPCYATMWNAEDQLRSVLVPPDSRPPKWMRLDDDKATGQVAEYTRFVLKLLEESKQKAFVVLERCALLDPGDDVDRHSQLHNMLADTFRLIFHGEALVYRLRAEEAILLGAAVDMGVKALVNEGKLGRLFEGGFKTAVERLKAVQDMRRQAESDLAAAKRLWEATYVTEARQFARAGRFHAASVHYNDLLDASHPAAFDVGLLQGVATSKAADEFAKSLRSFIHTEFEIVVLEAELAGVLAAAGRGEAAFSVWSEIIAQHRQLLVPLIKACEKYMSVYGLRLTDEVANALAEYSSLVDLCEKQLQRLDYPLEWMASACRVRTSDDEVSAAVAEYIKRMEREEAEPPPDRVMAIFRKWIMSDISFDVWARAKVMAARSVNWKPLLSATFTGFPIAPFAPKRYEADVGFTSDLRELFTAERLQACAEWAKAGGKKACSDRERMFYCVLLSWYWADRGSLTQFRAGLREASSAAFAAAEGEVDAATALTDQRNAISCVAASFVGRKLPFGVSMLRAGALTTIPPLLLLLEREWFARGLDPVVISRDVYQLNATIEQQVLENPWKVGDRRMKRWFFNDYNYQAGCVPDSWWEVAGRGSASAREMVNERFREFNFRQCDKEVIELHLR